ncbi:MAG: autorepressor SdpR family transcription factor [Vicinamibacterales bacterium]
MNEVFKALADPTRREILRLLRGGPMSAGVLADRFPQSRSTLSAHFAALKHANLVQTDRQGQTIFYQLNLSVFEQTVAALIATLGIGDEVATARTPAQAEES